MPFQAKDIVKLYFSLLSLPLSLRERELVQPPKTFYIWLLAKSLLLFRMVSDDAASGTSTGSSTASTTGSTTGSTAGSTTGAKYKARFVDAASALISGFLMSSQDDLLH